MAKELMWMAITSILATFDIHSPVDQNGVPLKPDVEYGPIGNLKCASSLLVYWNLTIPPSYPPQFECVFVPRSSVAKSLIDEYMVEDVEWFYLVHCWNSIYIDSQQGSSRRNGNPINRRLRQLRFHFFLLFFPRVTSIMRTAVLYLPYSLPAETKITLWRTKSLF